MRSFKRHPLALAALGALALAGAPASLPLAQTVAPHTLPQGLQVVAGQVRTATQGSQLTVSNSGGAILNWNSFSIGAAAGVHFEQASAASKVLNRVTGQDPSAIFGSLTSNGQVWLLNPNGVLFGAGARVDVAGLVASTLRLNDNDFLNRRYHFNALAGDAGSVRNEGSLRTSLGGQVVLLGERVDNRGSVEAGSVSIASARSVDLVDTGAPNLVVRVHAPAGEVLNLGRLVASGGSVDVMGAIVNQQGLVQADTLAADAQGRIVLRASDTLTLAADSTTRAAAIDLLGERVALTGNALADASAEAGGGRIRIGGGLMGRDASVPNARAVFIGPEATVRADAGGAHGDGGTVIVWSDEATRAYGRFSAQGGSAGGRGGFIETSGGWIDARPAHVDVRGASGAGTWLIDPNNILINNTGPDTNITGNPNFTTTGDSSVISTATITAALNAGNSVTITTASAGSNSQAGDILMAGAAITVSPAGPVALTMNAARDIVVRDSSIDTSGAPLSITLNAAGSGVGAIEILRSSITTNGGNVTLQGTNAQALTLPDGTLTAPLRPAVGYVATTPPSNTSTGGRVGVNIEGSVLRLGSGTLRAIGTTPVDNSDGLRIGSASGAATTITAGTIDLYGHSRVVNPVNVDVGTFIHGDNTSLTATNGFTIEGSGTSGVEVSAGARLALNAPSIGPTFTIIGRGSTFHGVALFADDVDTGSAGRGSRITVGNALLNVTADATQSAALVMLNDAAAPGPLLDLAAATGATFTVTRSAAGSFGPAATFIRDVDLVLPNTGSTAFFGDLGVVMQQAVVSAGGGSLDLSGSSVALTNSLFTATAGPWAINFATTGANPQGVSLLNTIVGTNGGDVTFGISQFLSAGVLPATTVARPWVRTAGGGGADALELNNTAIDAGSGRIRGGGASTSTSGFSGGVTLDNSVLSAREIDLAGRSDRQVGLLVIGGTTLSSDRVLRLDGLSAGTANNNGAGLIVADASTLQLVDPNTSTGSVMALSGANRNGFVGTALSGGAVGSGNETRLIVSGAPLTITGTTSGGSTGLAAVGNAAGPGGLLFNTIGATAVTLQGSTDNGVGTGLSLQYVNLQGPQAAGAATLLAGFGVDGNGGPGARIDTSTLNTGGTLRVLGEGVLVSGSTLLGEAGVTLHADTGSDAPGVPVIVSGSVLSTTAAGAALRIEGANNDAARGSSASGGTGVAISGSVLSGSGAGSLITISGEGDAGGGSGVTFTRTPMSAGSIAISGRGVINGDGVSGEDLTGGTLSLLSATNLSVSGFSANNAVSATRVGVRLGANVELALGSGGTVVLNGDGVLLGNSSAAAAPAFRATGAPASFTVGSTGSQLVANSTLDFRSGSGTAVTLLADSDGDRSGRARLTTSSIFTGGGALAMSGFGVSAQDTGGNPLQTNVTLREGASGVLLNGPFTVDAGAGAVSITGSGAPGVNNGQAGGIGLLVQGTGSSLVGSTVALDGRGVGTLQGVSVGDTVTPASLAITSTGLTVTGQASTGVAAIEVRGGSVWASSSGDTTLTSLGGEVNLDGALISGNNITLSAPGAIDLGTGTSRLTAAQTAALVLTGTDALSIDGSGAPVFSATFSGMSPTSTVRATAPNTSGLAISAPVSVPGRLVFEMPSIDLQRGASVAGGASGDAVVLRAPGGGGLAGFSNSAGATALAAPNGRWVVLADSPATSSVGGLPYAFSAYDLSAAPWGTDASGNYITPAAGNALGYSVAVSAVSGGSLAGTLTKVYDASTAIALSATGVTGLVAGDTLVIGSSVPGTLSDKNVGTNKPVGTAGAVFSVSDAQGRPVFGYGTPVFTATVTPATLLGGSGMSAASRAYDGTTTATLASLGSVNPLPGDTVFVSGATATFGDKNVGSNKPVTVNTVTLGGTDAGNYQLTPPSGLAASITPLALPVGGLVGGTQVYDGTTTAVLSGAASITPLAGDNVTLAGTAAGSFANKNVGSGKPIGVSGLTLGGTDAGNYTLVAPASLTGTVTPLVLPVSGLTAASRTYNATTVAPLAGTATIAPLAGDTVTLAGTPAGSFANANVGTGKPVVVSGLTLAGSDAGNYSLVLPGNLSAAVTPAPLTVGAVTAATKTYDATTAATLSGGLSAGVFAGDTVSLTLSGSFASANVGASVPVNWSATLGGASAGNYQLSAASGSTSGTITQATLTYVAAPATGTSGQALPPLTGSVTGFLGSDTLAASTSGTLVWSTPATPASLAGTYPITGGGLSALNYLFVQAPGNANALSLAQPTTGDPSTNATTVVTTAAITSVQVPVAMSTPTQGRVLDSTPAFGLGSGSGGGVAFRANSTLTLDSSGRLVAVAPGALGAPAGGGTGSTGGSIAATPGMAPAAPGSAAAAPAAAAVAATLAAQSAGEASGLTFEALDWSRLPRDEVQTLLAARARYKQKVFERSIFQLQQDPALADVQPCKSEAELNTGRCVITDALKREIQAERDRRQQAAAQTARPERAGPRVLQAALPAIERKLALLIGVNLYKDKRVPELRGAVPDARAVRGILEGRLGYETTVLENPSREAIVRAFNRLALTAEPNDSVIVYYAGHGVLVDINGQDTGFWLPSDVDAETPATWLSNADIARLVASVGAKQLMLVSDSCYSGQLVGKERVSLSESNADELLKRRAAVVMSSGGDEPVADEGKNGHSVFAWHFMRALQSIQGEREWQPGNNLFDRIKTAVQREFPQTPQYGASRAAGHQGNTDYLWERRQLEQVQQRAP
jgi:filamentous hemagglutinin family protein